MEDSELKLPYKEGTELWGLIKLQRYYKPTLQR